MKPVKIIISAKSIILTFSLIALALIAYQAKDVILLLFASFIIGSALFPMVDWLDKKMPRGLAVFLIYFAGFIILSTILIPFFVVAIQQTEEFLRQAPLYLSTVEKLVRKWQILSKSITLLPDLSHMIPATTKIGENIVSQSINFTISFFTGIVGAFTLATVVLFIILEKQELKYGFLKFFPEDMREKTEIILSTISQRVGGYVRGQLMVMFAVGIITAIALSLANLPFALLLGMVAGILEIIPIIGPILSAVPAVLIAIVQGPWWYPLVIVAIYLVVQRIENAISPYIYGKFLDMSPLVIISALLLAASTLGIIGVVLSPAIAAAAYVLVQELYLKKINPEK